MDKNLTPDQLVELAEKYLLGEDTEIDYEKCMEYALAAANAGSPWGCFYVAYLYFKGFGVENNFDEALKWYQKAAADPDTTPDVVYYHLGFMYDNGHGVPVDTNIAKDYYKKAAISGIKEAQYLLSRLLYLDDENKDAAYWLKRSARQDYDKAIETLEEMMDEGEFDDVLEEPLRDLPEQLNKDLSEMVYKDEDGDPEVVPGVDSIDVLVLKDEFLEEFGVTLPDDYLNFLRHYNGWEFDGRVIFGMKTGLAETNGDYDIIEQNKNRWIPSDAGEDAVLLGWADDDRFVYMPSKGKYAVLEFILDEEFDTIEEMLKYMVSMW